MEFDHWSEKNVKNMLFLMDTPSVKKPPKTYAETPPNPKQNIDTLRIHTLPDSSRFDGPNPIPTIGL